MNHERRECGHGNFSSGIILGIGVILLGVVLLLDQIPGIGNSSLLDFVKNLWPLILIAMGIARIRSGETTQPARGWVLVAVGAMLLLMTLGHGRFDHLIGPAAVLAAGVLIVLATLRKHRRTIPDLAESADFVRATAVLSGFKKRVHDQAFKGGELTAIFGGFELDLRTAVMETDSARIDVFLMFGGGEIRVPEGWDVSVEITSIAGGVGDKTGLLPEGDGPRPRLILSGTVLFGGIEVKP